MAATNPTSSLGVQNWYADTLSQACGAGDTTINVNNVPSPSEGYLIIDPNNISTREVIHYTSKGSGTVILPGTGDRGLDGTTAQAHAQGTAVVMNYTSSHYTALQSGNALKAQAISPTQLNTGALSAVVLTSETTSSTSYADLATTTDTVTVTIGSNGLALVIISSDMVNNTNNDFTFVTFAASGANTIAASDTRSFSAKVPTASGEFSGSWGYLATGLSAGSTVFKMKYRVNAGTGTFSNRYISVIPL